MVFFSETRLSSDESTSELADNIMTNRIISVHRLVSPTLTFGIYNGDTPAIELHKEKSGNFSDYISFFNDETHGAEICFVEIDRIVFYLLSILLISNKAIKYFLLLLLICISVSYDLYCSDSRKFYLIIN